MIDTERLTKILHFLETIDLFKNIYRATYIADLSRNENDAEHTWHMAMFALLLNKELGVNVDLVRTLELILVHDLVEVYAGDTYAYDVRGHLDKQEREEQAAQHLFALLPENLEVQIYHWWQEFEQNETAEARFANTLDKLQAFAQNVFSNGYVWRERHITEQMSRIFNEQAMAFDPAIALLFDMLYQRAKLEKMWPDKEKAT